MRVLAVGAPVPVARAAVDGRDRVAQARRRPRSRRCERVIARSRVAAPAGQAHRRAGAAGMPGREADRVADRLRHGGRAQRAPRRRASLRQPRRRGAARAARAQVRSSTTRCCTGRRQAPAAAPGRRPGPRPRVPRRRVCGSCASAHAIERLFRARNGRVSGRPGHFRQIVTPRTIGGWHVYARFSSAHLRSAARSSPRRSPPPGSVVDRCSGEGLVSARRRRR